MQEITRQLSHAFNVKIEITDPELRSYHIRANFTNGESLEEMLELLKGAGNFNYTITNNTIIISTKLLVNYELFLYITRFSASASHMSLVGYFRRTPLDAQNKDTLLNFSIRNAALDKFAKQLEDSTGFLFHLRRKDTAKSL